MSGAAVTPNSFTTPDGWTVQSNTSTGEEIKENLDRLDPPKKDEPKPEPGKSEAAAVLGKAGGEAAAKARKIKPIPDRKSAEESERTRESISLKPREAEETSGKEEPEEVEGIENPKIKDRILRATRKEAEAKRLAAESEERARRAEYRSQRLEEELRLRADETLRTGRDPGDTQRPQYKQPPFKPDEFPEYEDYLAARESWNREQWEAEAQERAAISAYAAQLDQTVGSYAERMQEAFGDDLEARIPDWPEEIFGLRSPRELRPSFMLQQGEQVTALTVVADEIVSSEQAPQIVAYLSEHPDIFQRLATLRSPQAVQREMAKVEARIEAASAGAPAPVQAVSKAKPPVRPVTGSPIAATDEVTDDMSYDEHVRIMNARERRPSRR